MTDHNPGPAGVGEAGEDGPKYKLPDIKQIRDRNTKCSMITIVNNSAHLKVAKSRS